MKLLAENVGVYWLPDGEIEIRVFHDDRHRVLTSITVTPEKAEGYTFDRDTSEITDEWEKVRRA